MFSHKHYDDVANAYIRGLEKRAKAGQPLDRIASVASVFVSRVETLIDKRLEEKLKAAPNAANAALRGTSAVANAKLIYQRFVELFHSDRFKPLAAKGAHVQRPLWASTGTKDPKYSDIKYVQELIGPDTVNTMPPATMDAYRDHGDPRLTVTEGVDQARAIQKSFAAIGVDFNEVGEDLQKEGVESFSKSFEDLMGVIKKRCDAVKPS
jgi:transaldolase/glucose-6-phosphate isomerase